MIKVTEIFAYMQKQFDTQNAEPKAPLTDASLKALMQHDSNPQHYDVIMTQIKGHYVTLDDFIVGINRAISMILDWPTDDNEADFMHIIELIQPILDLMSITSVTNGADKHLTELAKLVHDGVDAFTLSRAFQSVNNDSVEFKQQEAMLEHSVETLTTGPDEVLTIPNRWLVQPDNNLWIENWSKLDITFATLGELYQYLDQCWSLSYIPTDTKAGARKDDKHAQDSAIE